MKKLLFIAVIFTSLVISAQNITNIEAPKPVYEVEDGLVKVTNFYVTGEIREQGFYDAEKKLTGEWIQYNKTGKRTIVANYYKGVKVGKWLVWQGDKMLQVDYEQSRVANVSEWKGTSTLADN
ncbi:nicotinic acid mononucleotide adenyltransferase [Flavicella sp.]|uniref:nicotinic acid mononucleotide adenyltransferase n=1 Tax=Flavicella sp. TaxID=2957742 RepID=UPI0030179391